MRPVKKSFQYGKHLVTLETGVMARQATAAVFAKIDDTAVLVTVVASKETGKAADFFPLSVYYQEKTYAAGKIPGGFFKREGRPTEKETLTSRLIDRPIRPLFAEGFIQEVQIVATVLSVDGNVDPDIVALIGTSAALSISGLPFKGPVGAARVGYHNGQYLLNPTNLELKTSDLDLVVAGTKTAVLMVESEAKELSETVMLGAVEFGHQQFQTAIQAIEEFSKEVIPAEFKWQAPQEDTVLQEKLSQIVHAQLVEAYKTPEKAKRLEKIKEIKQQTIQTLLPQLAEQSVAEIDLVRAFSKLEEKIVRSQVLTHKIRIDGRDLVTIRPISIQVGVLPRTHGSTLFTRGETQALVVTTLGTEKDSQIIDALDGERKEAFLLHYNFPPFCVGEIGMMSGPKRREIGHGRLARRAMVAVMPNLEQFPYAIRIVSEITESNGSSSMATVCGSSLAMMDAGVPIKAPVAGVAMGLIKEGERFAVLSDILGDEDHLGDMDFKVAGTEKGVTALQMDIKIDGITQEIMQVAMDQAKAGRLHVLKEMSKVISVPRTEVSQHAPRIVSFNINPEKIRDVIGKGGTTIRAIIEETGVTIDITDDGLVKIGAVDSDASAKAREIIEGLTSEPEVGQIYEGKVTRLLDFGAIVSIMRNKDGLVHISEICNERVEQVGDKLTEGQEVRVKLIEIDRMGRLRLSIKRVED